MAGAKRGSEELRGDDLGEATRAQNKLGFEGRSEAMGVMSHSGDHGKVLSSDTVFMWLCSGEKAAGEQERKLGDHGQVQVREEAVGGKKQL